MLTVLLALACSAAVDEPTAPSTAAPAQAPTLRFSAIPDQNTTLLKQKYDPVAAYLTDALEVPVEYVPAVDYSASVEMFKNGDIHLAWFGGLTGVQARKAVPGALAIAQGAEDPRYYSYVIAHESTGLTVSDDFPEAIGGLPFSFGSESSTSGRLMPEFFIREATGLSPAEFFTEGLSYSGAHDKTAKLVASGQVKAGALSYKAYDALVEKGEIDPEVCRVIWKTPHYADYNFTAHPELESMYGEGFTRRLQTALVGMTDPTLLDAFPRSAMIPAQNEDFARIEEVAAALGMVR